MSSSSSLKDTFFSLPSLTCFLVSVSVCLSHSFFVCFFVSIFESVLHSYHDTKFFLEGAGGSLIFFRVKNPGGLPNPPRGDITRTLCTLHTHSPPLCNCNNAHVSSFLFDHILDKFISWGNKCHLLTSNAGCAFGMLKPLWLRIRIRSYTEKNHEDSTLKKMRMRIYPPQI